MSRAVQLPQPSPLTEAERAAWQRLAERDDAIGDLARDVLQSDRELRTS